uniref:Uncharacterized protein n=1 Tax=Octopus bimaculoides TaxID=37653 RepID=A0A0L8HSD0_OCTBM
MPTIQLLQRNTFPSETTAKNLVPSLHILTTSVCVCLSVCVCSEVVRQLELSLRGNIQGFCSRLQI